MLIPDGTNQYFSGLAQLFQREVTRRHAALVVADSDSSRELEVEYLGTLLELEVSGIVFISVGTSMDAYRLLGESGLPVLVIDREVPLLERSDFVLTDNRSGMRMAVEHLTSLGHSRVALIKGLEDTEPGRVRRDGFLESCEEFDVDTTSLLHFDGDFSVRTGVAAAENLLNLIERADWPTAVVASNDLMAIGFMQRIQEAGLVVPRDISVVGFDDVPLCGWVYPSLTSVRQETAEIASVGTRLLFERITSGSLGTERVSPRLELVEPTLSVRRSSATADRS